MKLLLSVSGEKEHALMHEDEATGIRCETHTPVRANRHYSDPDRFGRARSYWYHPQEPREVTHGSYEEALAAACEAGIIAATVLHEPMPIAHEEAAHDAP